MENMLLWVPATGVDQLIVPKKASQELVRVISRAVCSAFGAALFKGEPVEFPRQFAQSIAGFRTRAWRAGREVWSATMAHDRSQQRSICTRRLRPGEPDHRTVMDLLVGELDRLPWETAVAVRNTLGHPFLRDRLDHDPDMCGTCAMVVAACEGEREAWDTVLERLDADWTLVLDLYRVLRSGEPPACPELPSASAERASGADAMSPAVDADGYLLYPL